MDGDVNQNKITAKVNVSGGILNNEKSSIQSIDWNEVKENTITATEGSVTGGFIQNKLGTIDNLHIGSFSGNTINSKLKVVDGGILYNESGTINDELKIGQIIGNTIHAKTEINGLITNITGTINSISINSVSDNKFEMNFLRGGVINLQGANVNNITIDEINNNTIIGDENSTSTGFVLYLKEAPNDLKVSSSIGNLTVGKVSGNVINATNITSLLLRSALVPVENATVISKNGNITVDEISNNNLVAIECNDNARIGNIKAYFEGNYVLSNNDSAYGGAISNFYVKSNEDYKNAIIDSINSTFENNSAKTESTNPLKGAYGGAIVNTATIKAINNSIFKNNYASSINGSSAHGGAIYTRQDLVINANNNGLSEFTGNYVSTDGGATKNYEAISVGAAGKTLTLNATTNGTILLNDYINGVSGYNVLLTGDDKGTIKLYNNADFKGGANVSVDGNVLINTADGVIQNFSEFNSLNSSASAKYNIDLDFSKVSGDGKENYTALMAGIGSKTGYNFEFNDGKFIIQPSLLMAYTYVNTFDYTNAAGIKISSDPLHSIQLHPSIKLMGNVGRGWQPYASVGMVWNILNETRFAANNVRLPEMSIRPYVEYGVGLQKVWQDKYTGFVQAMLRNGGRNGVALTFGFKWAVGKDNKPIERVQNDTKHVLKAPMVLLQTNESSPQKVEQSQIFSTQKSDKLSQTVVQISNGTIGLSSKLNILTPQQLAQRANLTISQLSQNPQHKTLGCCYKKY